MIQKSDKKSYLGWFLPNEQKRKTAPAPLEQAIATISSPLFIIENKDGSLSPAPVEGMAFLGDPNQRPKQSLPIRGFCPRLPITNLGDRSFCRDHKLEMAYLGGSMANGISSVQLVEALGKSRMLGFFGSAGLSTEDIKTALNQLESSLGKHGADNSFPWGVNLIHTPNEPRMEDALVDIYLERGIQLIEASAYLDLTPAVVRYRVHGIYRNSSGEVVAPNKIIAKISRIEIARKFMSPAPRAILDQLVAKGLITTEQAILAQEIPVAQDLTAEADSGGHTDNRPSLTLVPTILTLRDSLQSEFQYRHPLRVGTGGGIATPASAAAAFALGAAYLVTGSVNQACIESGSSDLARSLLCQAEQADITMAPAADMFEMGVNVQVLKRGTMFAMRGTKLFNLYKQYNSLNEIPSTERSMLEKTLFRQPLDEVWNETREFFLIRDPRQVERAEADPKHKMALVFRSYLGRASRWANAGVPDRQVDYQIWCGPAMGAFNEWARDTFLEVPANRKVVDVAFNILYGAAIQTRINELRVQGVTLPPGMIQIKPRTLNKIKELSH